MKHKVDVGKVDEQFRPLVKPVMTNEEIGRLGTAIVHYKIECFKNRCSVWKRKLKGLLKRDTGI